MDTSGFRTTVGDEVITSDGATVGHVVSIVDQAGQPPFLRVKDSGLFGIGTHHFLVPIDAITSIGDAQVHVSRTREDLEGIPAHDEKEPRTPEYFESLYAWWFRANEN